MSVIPARRSAGTNLVLVLFRVLLGVLFLSVWASNLHKGLYGADAYRGLIRGYVKNGDSPAAWKDVMTFAADHAAVFSKLQLVGELALGVLLVLGLATRPVGLAAGLFLGSLWLSEIGVPHEWVWSLVFPAVAAFAVGLLSAGRTLGLDALVLDRPPLDRLPRWAVG
jgi:uncharacterized membrane protein YphA (DoxX/SURF4 family)